MWGVVSRGVTVGADVIGAEGVDGDEQDVGLRAARPGGERRKLGPRRRCALARPPTGVRAARRRQRAQRERGQRRALVGGVAQHLAAARAR